MYINGARYAQFTGFGYELVFCSLATFSGDIVLKTGYLTLFR